MKILTPQQKLALATLAASSLKEKFYWTGGTLLAYHYLHHRQSEDLDFFSDTPFSFADIEPWVKTFQKRAGFAKVTTNKIFDRWELFFKDPGQLRIEFVYYNGEKKRLGKRKVLLGVTIDSLKDIAANKTFAYFDRNEPKDLFDLYFLIKKKEFTVNKLLSLCEQKFGVAFPEDLFWSEAFKTLPLLENLRPLLLTDSEMARKKLLKEIESFFKKGARRFLASRIKES